MWRAQDELRSAGEICCYEVHFSHSVDVFCNLQFPRSALQAPLLTLQDCGLALYRTHPVPVCLFYHQDFVYCFSVKVDEKLCLHQIKFRKLLF